MNELLNTLKVGHEMSVDIVKFVCSCAELVPKMRRLEFHEFMQWLRQGERHVYVLVTTNKQIS